MTLAMSPAAFAEEIAIPTVEEFRDDRTSRRRSYLAAIVVFHLRDYLAEARAAKDLTGDPKQDRRAVEAAAEGIDKAIRAVLPDDTFDVVRGVANGSKHAVTRSAHVVPFTAGGDDERPTVLYGEDTYGSGVFGGTGGREIVHGGARLDLYRAVQATLSAFLAAFPVELAGCTFDPYPLGW